MVGIVNFAGSKCTNPEEDVVVTTYNITPSNIQQYRQIHVGDHEKAPREVPAGVPLSEAQPAVVRRILNKCYRSASARASRNSRESSFMLEGGCPSFWMM